jgi:glycosyltransferase involved in cell wall biosynthesis
MKKVLIVTRRMVMGGIEKALISMLEVMPIDRFEVTVLVMGNGGELVEQVPSHVRFGCLYGDENTTLEKIWNAVKRGEFLHAFKIGWYTALAKNSNSVFDQEMFHSKMVPAVDTVYDLAIAYHVPASFPVVYVMNNIKAKKKAAWIHSDVSKYEKPLKRYREFYERFDKIFCVSQAALYNFIHMFPDLKDKTTVFYNILDTRKIEFMAVNGESYKDSFEGIRILTVGRLTFEKGHDIIPNVINRLISQGYNVRWYCLGDGEDRPKLENMIREFNLESHLILLGIKDNPYPYIKDCDIYVQPSRHEGYCITLAEARALNKPIITTDFVSAKEQINNRNNGLIVNFDENELFNAIQKLIIDNDLRIKFTNALKVQNINTSMEINKLYECL